MADDAGDMRAERVAAVRVALLSDFGSLLDLADVTSRDPRQREQVLLSRALAALAVRRLTGVTNAEAARCVVDGTEDCGLDALAVLARDSQLFLVQAKWSDSGTAGFGEVAAVRLIDALNKLRKRRFSRFNARVRAMSDDVNALLDQKDTEVTLVVASLGDSDVHPRVRAELADAREDLAAQGVTLRCRLFALEKAYDEVQRPTRTPQIGITAQAAGSCHYKGESYAAYMTIMSCWQIAAWYERYGDRLILPTLRLDAGGEFEPPQIQLSDPSTLLYYSNGLTVFCDEIDLLSCAVLRPEATKAVDFDLGGVLVVNGAATMRAVARAVRDAPERFDTKSQLHVRLIAVRAVAH